MMTDRWPYPGDAPLARARRVAHAYRAALHEVDPDRCKQLDDTIVGWGQTWAVPRIIRYAPDDLLTVPEAADVAFANPAQLRIWRARGLLAGRLIDGHWRYRAGDVIALAADRRRRRRKEEDDRR